MTDLTTLRPLLSYGDWANDRVLAAASGLPDGQLDREMEIGPGTLRRTLIHLWAGEDVWLRRWSGEVEARWPTEREPVSVAVLRERFGVTRRARDAFLSNLDAAALPRAQAYRDSRGALFTASLSDMLLQACVHSIHHRAQAVNIVRRLGGGLVELDYMMRLRQPA